MVVVSSCRRRVIVSSRRLVIPSRLFASRCSSSQIDENIVRNCKILGNIMIVCLGELGMVLGIIAARLVDDLLMIV